MQALDTTVRVYANGRLDTAVRNRLAAYLSGYAKGLEDDSFIEARIRIGKPTHSNKATRLYFGCLRELAAHLNATGNPVDTDGLHFECKGKFLSLAAQESLEETGEEEEYVYRAVLLSGRTITRLTTTKLSTFAFSRYIDYVDRLAAGYGCDLSEYLDGEDLLSYRSGRIAEDEGQDEVEYVETDTPGVYDVAPDREPERQPEPLPRHEATHPNNAEYLAHISGHFEPTGTRL